MIEWFAGHRHELSNQLNLYVRGIVERMGLDVVSAFNVSMPAVNASLACFYHRAHRYQINKGEVIKIQGRRAWFFQRFRLVQALSFRDASALSGNE